jgi:hypothetical protein
MARITFTAGQVLAAADINEYLVNEGYQLVETLYFTSNGTFTKATYPWLRAIKVKVQGGGAGGAGAATTDNTGCGGSAGGYAESFITDIAGLDASIAVTRGGLGAGGAAGANNGNAGGTSSFGSLVVATGGEASVTSFIAGNAGVGTAGDLLITGGAGIGGAALRLGSSNGGSSMLGGGAKGLLNNQGANAAVTAYGAGGSGGSAGTTARSGGTGAAGIVIVELYA